MEAEEESDLEDDMWEEGESRVGKNIYKQIADVRNDYQKAVAQIKLHIGDPKREQREESRKQDKVIELRALHEAYQEMAHLRRQRVIKAKVKRARREADK